MPCPTQLRRVAAVLCPLLLVAMPARAAVITQTIALDQTVDSDCGCNITGAEFNTKLGTLDSVSARIAGSFNATVNTDGVQIPPEHVPASVLYSVELGNNQFSGVTGSFILSSVSSTELQGGTRLRLAFNALTPAGFETGVTSPGDLGFFGFGLATTAHFGAPDFLNSFDGTLTLNYVYTPAADVPEPGTLALLGAALLLLAGTRQLRRSRTG